ncbi:lipid IV(A) 3-deoxy-D-manno-octulosonic acid transferase [Caldimonas sp. KR1-144]|uniref:lipid IV(A) 3-deoxy-D-manno-octulosonic acid transferase n=1 Tax=Caldimonas sp. KR1-144 TaxID=3400911 RepID=UPI003C00EEF6
MQIARWLYSGLLVALAPAYRLRLAWRGRREAGYNEAVGERFGRYESSPPTPGAVWIHAVSLGETRAAAALIDALHARRPRLRILLTHGTATGREAGRALLREGDRQVWLPYDTPGAVRRFLRHHRPSIGVLMETELWPNLVAIANELGVPLLQANARLSEKSLRRGERFAALLRPAVAGLTEVLAQTEADAQRLRGAGARTVQVVGNLKFDMTPSPDLIARGAAWRAASERPLVLAASTREGEEAALLAAWREAAPPARLLLVPRHPQRFDEVARLVGDAGLSLSRRSAWQADRPDDGDAQVWLGDSLGEMPAYYAAARLALLGGSFEPLGGQNLIEAAACACPLLIGPSTFNFAQAAELSLAAGASERLPGLDAAVARAVELLAAEPATLEAMSRKALDFAAAHRGAADRMAAAILARLPAEPDQPRSAFAASLTSVEPR